VTDFTEDRLLNGRVALRQPQTGFRAGLDAVLLAAFVPAKPGETVLEAGPGSGAAFLCLAANPPYWPGGTPPPGAIRRAATHEAGPGLADWVRFMAAAIAPRGSLSLILPAARFDAAVAAIRGSGFGAVELLPLWPRAGVPAKRVLLRARKGTRSPARVLPGLVLHEADGRFTAAAEAILRDATALNPD